MAMAKCHWTLWSFISFVMDEDVGNGIAQEGNDQIDNLLLCPRDCRNYNDTLQMFRKLKPPNCLFIATKIWRRDTRKKNCCLWCVLYQAINPGTQYLRGTQAKQLRMELNTRKPVGGEIVDYEFHQDAASGETGWLFIWKNLACTHRPNFLKKDNTQKGELFEESMVNHCIY
ncbi:uncharacterized protein LOC123005995 [Tribolium madens]|uniref:uncharacterized protein LOC123005995 n=1 Tax=Tribolium madens TaxID=41895 RepID=UPI001CF7252D|nr:uncharacterized protein LOC123005995 [Tribolium madens]